MNTGKVKKDNISQVILFLILIFPFFKYTYLTANFPITNKIYLLFQILSFAILIFINIKNKCFKISKVNLLIVLYLTILSISTIINEASIFESLYLSFRVITFCLIVEYGIKNHTEIFLKTISCFLIFLVITNFISILLYPNGMYVDTNVGYYQNWLLGYKNIHILFILPAILFSFLYSYYKYDKLKIYNYIFLIISFISIIIVDSSTSLVGLIIILIFIIFNRLFNKTKLFNIRNYTIFTVIFFFGIIIFRIQEKFKFIIENILNRSINLTNRTYIWDYVINFIKEKPLLGYGIEDSMIRYNKSFYYRSFHAHNEILEIIYKSGFIGLIVFISIIMISIKELIKNKENKIVKFISIMLFAYMFMMLTEVYSFEYFMFLFVVCYNVKYLIKEVKNENNINN